MSCWPEHYPTRRERFSLWRRHQRERIWRRLHPRQAAQADAERAETFRRIREQVACNPFQLFNPGADIASAYHLGVDLASGPDWTAGWEPPPVPLLRRAWRAVLNVIWRVIEAV